MSRTPRRASSSTSVAKGRWGKIWAHPFGNEVETLVIENTETAEIPNAFLLQSLLRPALGNPKPWRQERKSGEKFTLPWLGKNRLEISQTWHPQIHGPQWDALTHAERCYWKATLHHLWKIMENRRGTWGLDERQFLSTLPWWGCVGSALSRASAGQRKRSRVFFSGDIKKAPGTWSCATGSRWTYYSRRVWLWPSEIPSNSNHSVILRFCDSLQSCFLCKHLKCTRWRCSVRQGTTKADS